ncbi:putative cation channel family domain-containing protein [Neospora caninum Liverpool]|uniref:Putative cation channel family domain-containing protein n=1 Tax=Neospora caninum (strain Liverpool) TaxID=572307 RepID=F0VMY5_NEOCL|nr:putative cation channel family domain-containing protein [Neospora caninum Liverpool]CBZ55081.1 putative cation channel family domain-containing protein [Neospora caninum Liverpool]|eukprot:XP_003885109.1 putative cation channel family domain-containing protein [Neospora caninum Liverpool]
MRRRLWRRARDSAQAKAKKQRQERQNKGAFVFFASDAAPGNAWWEGVSEPGLANETLAPVLSNYRPGLVARLARPLLLALFCYPVIGMLLRIVRTLPKVRTIILAALLSVLLFDWLGVILFAGTSGHDEFHSFQSGCISLLLVVTTVRLPQVLLRGYTVHEVAVLFIVVFYLLTAVLLGLFAAAFYTAYRDGDIADSRKQLALSARYLSRAFDLLLASQEERTAASVSSASSCVAVESSHSRQAAGAERAGEERGKPEASVAFEAWREFYVHYAALSGRPQCASANRGKVLDFCEGPETKQEGSRQCGGGHAPPSPLALSLSSSLVASQLLPPFLRLLSSPSSDSAIAGDVEESERETDRTKGKQHETAEETGLLDPESPAGCVGDRENPSAAPSPSSSPSRLSVSLSPCRSEPSENSRQDVASTRQTLSSVSSLLPRSSLSPSPFAASQGRLARTGTATTLQVSDESVSSREKRATSKEGEGEEEGEGDAVGLLSGRQGRGEEELDANEEHCVERVSVDAPTWRFALPFLFVKRVVGGNRAGNEFPKSGRRRHASKRPGPQTHAIADGEEDVELFFLLQRGEAQSASRHRLAKSQFVQFVSTLAAYDAVKQKEEQRLWQSDSCRFAVHRRLLNVIADVCVVASLILTYMQTRKFIRKASTLSGEEIESSPVDLAEGLPASCFGSVAGAYWIQNALSFVYLVSVVVRIRLTSSMQRYTGFSLRERFDIVVGGGVMVLELACLWAGSASAFHPLCTTETFDDLSRCLAFIRVLRGIRICFRISPLRKMIVSLVAAVSALEPVLLVLVVIFCAYGTVGMELFGGIIKCDMEHLPPKGPDMEDPTDWGVLNFNDFFASLVTLFLLTVNGWDDSLKALVKHTSVFSCGAYFVSFYILTDTIILNLLVALVLEAYDQVASSTSGSSWRPVL